MAKKATVPKSLSREAQALYENVLKDYPIADAMGLTVLRFAFEALDDYNDARAKLKREGAVMRDRNGIPRPSPYTRIRDNARDAFYRGFKLLDLEPPALPK